MLRNGFYALSALSLAGMAVPSLAAPCRDAHGKFIKCATSAKPAPKKCKNARGQFAKCGTPGAKPA